MKKFIILAFAIISTSFLCAEQPFFLKNWIIPENVRWGTTDRIPAVEGAFIEQPEIATEPLTEVTIYEEDFSVIEVPPYFAERKLLGWEMSYADILAAFKANNDFSVEERAKYQVLDYFDIMPYMTPKDRCIAMDEAYDSEDCILCDKYLDIYPKSVCGYYIQLGFATSEPESLIESFKVVYCMDDSAKPCKVLFEQNNRIKWDAMTETEKLAVALSALIYDQYDLEPCIFDATPTGSWTNYYLNFVLNDFGISSKDDLSDTGPAKTYFQNIKYNFNLFKDLLDSNPEKTAVELAAERNLDFNAASLLFLIDDMGDKIGKHDVEMIGEVHEIMWLRLGAGAGFYTHEEAVEAAGKIAKKLIKEYLSFEDFAAHLSLVTSCINFTNDNYLESAARIMRSFDSLKKTIPVDEIAFDGSEADRTAVLKIQDAYYKPEKHATWVEAVKIFNSGAGTNEIRNPVLVALTMLDTTVQDRTVEEEGLLAIRNCIKEYGNLKCIEKLYGKIAPSMYVNVRTTEEYFNMHYSYIWERLPEMEQYAIAFSSNLFELNKYFQLDFTNNIYFGGKRPDKYDRRRFLNESWSITDHKTLVDMVASLNIDGHSGSYDELRSYIKKHPGKSPIEIGEIENLSVLAVTRLYFVQKMDSILGEHGIEAWDDGRALTLLRWGIYLDYIDYEEAMALSIPIVNKIRDNYVSWEDFMAHYIAGRCFWGLIDSDYKNLAEASVKAAKDTRSYVPCEKLIFTAENADFSHKMTLDDCYYNPTDEALAWEKVQKLYQADENADTLAKLSQLEAENPAISNVVFYWHLGMLLNQKGCAEDALNYIEKHLEYVDSLPEDDGVYINTQYYYLLALDNTSRFEECISRYVFLPASLKKYAEIKYMYAYANLVMSYNSNNQLLVNIYRRRAYETFKEILDMEIQLNEFIMSWMEAYRNNAL